MIWFERGEATGRADPTVLFRARLCCFVCGGWLRAGKGAEKMTKAKARQRAKANAAQKARKRKANADRPGQQIHPGQFDPGTSSIKGPRVNANAKNFGGARRGAARSK